MACEVAARAATTWVPTQVASALRHASSMFPNIKILLSISKVVVYKGSKHPLGPP